MNLAQATQDLESHIGVPLGDAGWTAMTALYRRLGMVCERDQVPQALQVAEVWRNFLAADRSLGEARIEQVYLLGTLECFARTMDGDLDRAFAAVGMQREFSLLEMTKRRAARLYTLGRNLSVRGRDVETGRKLLKAAVRLFDSIEARVAARSGPFLRTLHGMRGVARVLLAREKADPAALEGAALDLEKSFALGDSSPQNLAYRRECALTLYDSSEDPAALDRCEALLASKAPRDQQLLSDLARYHQNRAVRALHYGEGDFWPHMELGVAACDEALGQGANGQEDRRIFNNQRGFFHYLAASAALGLERADVLQHLTDAIEDLRIAATAGLGGSCLAQALLRRAAMLKKIDLDAATADLGLAADSLDLVDSEIAASVGAAVRASLLDCSIRRAMADADATGIAGKCRELLAMGEVSHRHLLTIIHGLRFSWSVGDPSAAADTVAGSRAAVAMCESMIAEESIDEHSALLLGAAADLSSRLDSGPPSDLTLDLYRIAIERQSKPNAAFLSQAADSALQAGKERSGAGRAADAVAFYEDAVKRQEWALRAAGEEGEATSANFQPVVAHSKCGEAYLRLRAGSAGSSAAVKGAIFHLEEARRLGNETPQLLGLLGDAYYRRGYHERRREDLERALELKLSARSGGHASRENFSLVGRLYHRLYELTGDPQLLAQAIEQAIAAWRHRSADAQEPWPWPLFQLAEYTRSSARQSAVERLPAELAADPLVDMFRRGDRAGLLGAGVETALQGREFRRKVLGGRSAVFILDDPHELLSTTMVLKPTDARNADVERATVSGFFSHLREAGLLKQFALPAPIAILPTDKPGEVIYAMERARAEGLNKIICGEGCDGYAGEAEVGAALHYLAHYHRWADGGPTEPRSMIRLADNFSNYIRKLNLTDPERTELDRCFRRLAQMKLPFARKKDAHPENWLVTAAGKLVMIDLEATSRQPCLLDVAQLLDDYPVFRANPDGWQRRMSLCHDYWHQLFGATPEAGLLESAFETLAIFRCAFGITFCAKESDKPCSSSALAALGARENHYLELLNFLQENASSALAKQAATLVRRGALSRPSSPAREARPIEE